MEHCWNTHRGFQAEQWKLKTVTVRNYETSDPTLFAVSFSLQSTVALMHVAYYYKWH